MSGVVIPLLLSAGYLILIALHFRGAEGGFGSLADVATLFQKQELLLAGWIHYLAFDLFIGALGNPRCAAQRHPAPRRHSVPGDDVHARPDRPAVLLRDPHRQDAHASLSRQGLATAERRMISELRHRDPLLFWIGALMLLALLVVDADLDRRHARRSSASIRGSSR